MDVTEGCFVYTPKSSADGDPRPKKKRKTADTSYTYNHGFVPLLDGKEKASFATLRSDAFESIWSVKEGNLENVLNEANSETIAKIFRYIENTDPLEAPGQIPIGLVTSGLATTSSGSMYEPVAKMAKELRGCHMICVPSAECTNLKSTLKTIIRNGTENTGDVMDEDDEPSRKTQKLLNYDLEALQNHLSVRNADKCVLFFQNSEALEGHVLSELIDLLCSWQDRIASIILFEVAISVDLFQEKFMRRTILQLRGTTFDSKSHSEILDLMFRAATSPDDENPLYLGASSSKLLLDRQEEHIQSAKGFISALKYMYLTHFFLNPLSVLLSRKFPADLDQSHISSIRGLNSFTHFLANESEEDPERANKMQSSDGYLISQLPEILNSSRESLLNLLDALQTLHYIHQHTNSKYPLTWSTLYTKAMSGALSDAPLFRELLLTVRKLPSDRMSELLASMSSIRSLNLHNLSSDLSFLLSKASASSESSQSVILRSAHDPSHATTRTTVVSHKISLEKKATALSPLDTEYTRLSTRIHAELRNFFTTTLLAPHEIPLSEVLVFDAKGAVTRVLGAAPRAAVEKALSRPWGYLNCECCRVERGQPEDEEGLVGSEPATSVLWQLVQEAGTIINVEDLWRAFEAVVRGEGSGQRDETILALFYRGLAELRYLGVVKSSRKKVDHIMKMRWKGL